MKLSPKLFIFHLFLLMSCEFETETIPKVTVTKVDSAVSSDPKILPNIKPKTEKIDYSLYEEKLKSLPQIIHANDELKVQKREQLKTKIVDLKKDSLFSIKFGKTIDTNFISEYEFYIHKKNKSIVVYDKGEDRMIPLEDWKKMNEAY